MKNLLVFYIAIGVPLIIIIVLANLSFITSKEFTVLLFIYIFIYRTYTDGQRLSRKGVIDKKDRWKIIIPGSHFTYFKEIYLK